MTTNRIATVIAMGALALGLLASADAQQGDMSRAPKVAQGAAPRADDGPYSPAMRKQNLEKALGEPVDSVSDAPVAGLYEVIKGGEVFYTDRTGNFIMLGSLIDLRSKENLTRNKVQEVRLASAPKFRFEDLPLDAAVKLVKGTGKRRVAIFEDPNCGYCKRLEKSIQDIGDVTIYVFLYPVLGPDSLAKSKQIWCSADRSKAWNEWMQNATELKGEGACATPLDKNLALGKKYKVDGTPTLFFGNNKRVEGAIDSAELERNLAAS